MEPGEAAGIDARGVRAKTGEDRRLLQASDVRLQVRIRARRLLRSSGDIELNVHL